MTLKRFALKYDRCSLEELQTFVKDRGVKVPSNTSKRKLQTKKFFREKLELADNNATFRFLDLIPELRNLVYRELLTLSPSARLKWKSTCWPQILCVSKDVNKEAKGILYEDNLFELKIYRTPTTIYPIFALYGGGYDEQSTWDDPLRRVFTGWHSHLRKVRHIKVTVDLGADRNDPDTSLTYGTPKFKGANHFLYSLCSYLSAENMLKKFEVHLDMKEEDEHELDRGLLWPLSKLHNADILHITGIPDDKNIKILDEIRATSVLQVDCIGDAIRMLDRADKLRQLSTECNLVQHYKEDIAGVTRPVCAILRTNEYVSEKNDEWLQRCNVELKKLLDGQIPNILISTGAAKWVTLDRLLDELH